MKRVITKYVPDANRPKLVTKGQVRISKWAQKHPKLTLKITCKYCIQVDNGCYVIIWRRGYGSLIKYGIKHGILDRYSILKEL